MRLTAKVNRVTGATAHRVVVSGPQGPEAARLSDPVAVEIVEQDGGCFLFRLDREGQCIADTWHPDIKDAQAQARLEYEIGDADWVVG